MHQTSNESKLNSQTETEGRDNHSEIDGSSSAQSQPTSPSLISPVVTRNNILSLQRTIGNRAVQRLLSRQNLQRQVAENASHVCNAGCNHVARIIDPAVEASERPLDHFGNVMEATSETEVPLSADLNASVAPVQRTLRGVVQRDDTDDRQERYHMLHEDLEDYMIRTRDDNKSNFLDTKLIGDSKDKALSLPRTLDGGLSDEAIEMMDRVEQVDAKKTTLDKYATFGVNDNRKGFFKDAKLKKALEKDINTVTGETHYPDLANVLKPNSKVDAMVNADMNISGVIMSVTYNRSDVNFAKRLGLLISAVAKVKAKGFTVPWLNVQVPKYSRELTINSDCSITAGNKTAAAQYMAPNLMHLGSSGIDNPQEEIIDLGRGNEYKFTSTEVDPSGVGTVVHELGHALHYVSDPGKFHDMSLTSFTGKGGNTAMKVSGYATGNGREFVAEVFLGMIYDKTYSEDVMTMYKALGGPVPG